MANFGSTEFLGIADDPLVQARALDDLIPDWRRFLDDAPRSWQLFELREHARTGRPLGTPAFVADLKRRIGRRLAPAKRGRKRRVTSGPASVNRVSWARKAVLVTPRPLWNPAVDRAILFDDKLRVARSYFLPAS